MNRLGKIIVKGRKRLLSAVGVITIAVPSLFIFASTSHGRVPAQSQNAGTIKFEFDVASIKPNKSDTALGTMGSARTIALNGGFIATNVTLMDLIRVSYGIEGVFGTDDGRVVGAPSWTTSERYDVDAKIDRPVIDALWKLKLEQRTLQSQQMLQALLADRFKMTVHRDSKDLPVYVLSVAKSGAKFREANPADTYLKGFKLPSGMPSGSGSSGREANGRLVFQGTAISELVALLPQMDRPIVDKTGLTGKYDFTFLPPPFQRQSQVPAGAQAVPGGVSNGQPSSSSPDFNIAPLSEALQNQIGLKLEATKSPLGIIVIDHVEKPSGN
jgi:bla regulator protein blaR1